jgi:hypothetical protein
LIGHRWDRENDRRPRREKRRHWYELQYEREEKPRAEAEDEQEDDRDDRIENVVGREREAPDEALEEPELDHVGDERDGERSFLSSRGNANL